METENCDMLDSTNNDTKHLMKLLTKFNLVQLIKSSIRTTATTKTIIDHIITNRSESVSKSEVLSFGISNHDAVFMTKHVRLPKLKASPRLLNVRNYKKFNLKAFRKDMNNVPFDEIKNISRDANEMWTLWENFFLDILNKHAPIIYIQLKAMIRQINYPRAEANKTGSSVLRQAYSQVRVKVNQKLYELRKNYYTSKIEQHKYVFKNTQKVLKDAIGKAHKTIEIEKINFEGKELTDKKQITELCNEHFVSIGDKLVKSILPISSQPQKILV